MEAVDRIAPLGTVPDEAVEANARIGALGPVSSPRLAAADLAFHASLVATAGSPRLERLHGAIMGEVRLSMAQVQAAHLLDAASIATEHAEILARIRRRDVAGAVAAVRRHLMRTESALAQHLASSGHLGAASHSSDDLPATDRSPS